MICSMQTCYEFLNFDFKCMGVRIWIKLILKWGGCHKLVWGSLIAIAVFVQANKKNKKNKQEEDKDPLFTQILIKALTKPRDVVLDTYYGGRLQPPALDGVTRCWTGLHRHYSNQIRLLLHCSFMKAVISISMMFFSNKVIMSRCPRFQVSVPLNPNVKVKYSYRENHS